MEKYNFIEKIWKNITLKLFCKHCFCFTFLPNFHLKRCSCLDVSPLYMWHHLTTNVACPASTLGLLIGPSVFKFKEPYTMDSNICGLYRMSEDFKLFLHILSWGQYLEETEPRFLFAVFVQEWKGFCLLSICLSKLRSGG